MYKTCTGEPELWDLPKSFCGTPVALLSWKPKPSGLYILNIRLIFLKKLKIHPKCYQSIFTGNYAAFACAALQPKKTPPQLGIPTQEIWMVFSTLSSNQV